MALAAKGYDVAIGHHGDKEQADEVVRLIGKDYGRECVVFEGNLEEMDMAPTLVQSAIEALGKLDVLVNNAGVTILGEIVSMDIAKMNTLINLNFRAPLLTMQAVGKHMIEQGITGNIINIASTRGERAYPRDAVYGGLKAALMRATQSIALELASHHIRVNAIAPGAIRVREGNDAFYAALGNKIPLGRMGAPTDIGKAVAWLVSEDAGYITGATFRIDGGLILPGMPEDVSPEAGYGWGTVKTKQ